jgi:peptidoglycan/LPS O-acetylase OafA/YrhL
VRLAENSSTCSLARSSRAVPVAARAVAAGSGEPRAPRQRFRRDIQGLRALAVILVIGNHANIPGFAGGYVGVDVFFVISGYVITQLLLSETSKGLRAGLADFYARRVRRIVPAATAALVGTLIVSEIALGTRLDPNLTGDVRWASVFAANFRLISTGSNYFVPGIHGSLITQFWSLAVEEQFYLAFPAIVLLIAHYVAPRHRLPVLSITLCTGIAASAWWSVQVSASEPSLAYYSPLTRFWEIGLGCLLAASTTRRPVRTVRSERIAVGLGFALIIAALMKLNATSVYPGYAAWLPCASTLLFIWAGAGGVRNPVTRALSTRPLGYLGAISYSLYLAHYVWLELPQQFSSPLSGPGWRLLEIAGAVVTAIASYHLLENPVRHSRRLAGDRVATVLMLCVCVAASWTAAVLVARFAIA